MPQSSSPSAAARLSRVLERNRAGERVGVYAIRDADPRVVRAVLEMARDRGQLAVVETTGGDAGEGPQDFADRVRAMAADVGLPADGLVLGGARLGPRTWRHLPAKEAMARAEATVARYARAGFGKLHFDCSLPCADDPDTLREAIVAKRAAALAMAAEEALDGSADRPLYVVTAQDPTPEGARIAWHAHERAFAEKQLHDALTRIVAIAMASGGGDDDPFRPESAAALAQAIRTLDGGVYEAAADRDPTGLIERHVAILHIGPAAVAALDEAAPEAEAVARIGAALAPYADACGAHETSWPR